MSKLEDLVPPLELCKLIPKGEFEDSAFIWDKTTSVGFWDGEDKDGNHIGGFGKIPHKKYRLRQNYSERCRKHLKEQDIELDIFPAPTLQEIMAELPPYAKNEKILACCVPDWADFNARVFGEHWRVGYTGDVSVNDKSPSIAALKLWLELKGIDYEQAQ